MKIEKISMENRENAIALVLDVFMEFESPDYSVQGVETFRDFINDKKNTDALEMYGAYDQNQLVGVIATRNNGSHIVLFFVLGTYHKRGIGRRLFERVIENSSGSTITVNSSPYAVEVYKRLGFTANSEEQITDGIRYTPMTYEKRD